MISFFIIGASFLGGWAKLTDNPVMHLGIFVFYLILVIFLAHLSYQYFERKVILKYRNKLIDGRN